MPAKKNIRSAFSPTDLLLLLLLAWYGLPAREVLPPLALFLTLKLLLSGKSAVTRALSLVAVWGWTAYEAVYGLMQVAGLRMSNHAGFAITGSFDNPGPYGGFIAVGVSVAFAYIVRYRKRFKGWYRGTMMAAALAAFVLGVLVLPASMSRAGWLAFAVAALLALVSEGRVRAWMKRRRGLCAATVAFSAVLCAGVFLLKKDSAVGRLHIWHMECRAIAERPLRGSGPGTALGAYGAAQEEYFRTHPDADEYIVQIAGCPEYAFNEYLGAGMERGIPALLLMAATAVAAVVNLRRRENCLACGMLALAVFALFSYPLATVQFRLLLIMMLASCGPVRRRHRKAEATLLAAALAACIGASLALKPSIDAHRQAEQKWKAVSAYIRYGVSTQDVEDLRPLYDELSDDYRYLYDLGYALHRRGLYGESNEVLSKGAAISSDPMFRVIMGRNHEAMGDYGNAAEEYLRAHYMVPCRIYPLLRLMRMQISTGRDAEAIETGKGISQMRVNPKNANMVRLQQEARASLDSLITVQCDAQAPGS